MNINNGTIQLNNSINSLTTINSNPYGNAINYSGYSGYNVNTINVNNNK